ncbi:MAG: C13 family peptidase [Candidatus Thorarchaeota archaeon]
MSKKSLFVFFLVVSLAGLNIFQFYYFTTLLPVTPQEDVPLDVVTILNNNKADYIGKTVTLDGYYVEGGSNISLLITEPVIFENNSLTPNNYLIIGGNVPSSLQTQIGAQVHLKGRITWANETEGLLEITYGSHSLIREGALNHLQNKFIDTSKLYDITQFPFNQRKYAVLISGGIKPEKAYSRYWNDITAMYFILTWLYGYDPQNIYIVYKDGIPENGFAPVHGPATHTYLQTVFTELENKMTRSDNLFIYTTNHGGSSGLSLWGPMDPYALTPNELNNMLMNIQYNQEIIVMEQCKSGVFIPTLSKSGRVILTAASPIQSSYGCDTEGPWDEFVYHFMSAVAELKINGDPGIVNSDLNNDGKVSMYEAFMYASEQDSRLENPYYDDDGDGSGLPAILLSLLDPADEGALGQNTFL